MGGGVGPAHLQPHGAVDEADGLPRRGGEECESRRRRQRRPRALAGVVPSGRIAGRRGRREDVDRPSLHTRVGRGRRGADAAYGRGDVQLHGRGRRRVGQAQRLAGGADARQVTAAAATRHRGLAPRRDSPPRPCPPPRLATRPCARAAPLLGRCAAARGGPESHGAGCLPRVAAGTRRRWCRSWRRRSARKRSHPLTGSACSPTMRRSARPA
eukprot:6935100-Prymnesium_polylepis.1